MIFKEAPLKIYSSKEEDVHYIAEVIQEELLLGESLDQDDLIPRTSRISPGASDLPNVKGWPGHESRMDSA